MLTTDPYSLTANGQTEITWRRGKRGLFAVAGSFDSATVKLEAQIGSTWVQLPNCSLTANGQAEFVSPSNSLRINISGVASAAALNVVVCGVEY